MAKIIKSKIESPSRDLIVFSKEEGDFTADLKAFGPDTHTGNLKKMREPYLHPETGKKIYFNHATSRQGIIASAYEFPERAKKEIFDPAWLQLAYIFHMSEGVLINPPIDEKGYLQGSALSLEILLKLTEPTNSIYLMGNSSLRPHFVFVPYDTFKQGTQSVEEFTSGGLARGLEYSRGDTAEYLKTIASKENYPEGINIYNFNLSHCPVQIVGIHSSKNHKQLLINGASACGLHSTKGFAFPVCE
jgi:hypothetical protein